MPVRDEEPASHNDNNSSDNDDDDVIGAGCHYSHPDKLAVRLALSHRPHAAPATHYLITFPGQPPSWCRWWW